MNDTQKQNLVTAWQVFASSESGGRVINDAGATSENVRAAFTVWLQIVNIGHTGIGGMGAAPPPGSLNGLGTISQMMSGAATPQGTTPAQLAAIRDAQVLLFTPDTKDDAAAVLKGLYEKEKRTLFTLPLLGTRMTTAKLIGAGVGGVGTFFLTRLLGPEVSDSIIGYLLPVAGAVVGTMVGGMIENHMYPDPVTSSSGAGAAGAQTLTLTPGNAQSHTINLKVNGLARTGTVIGTREGTTNNMRVSGITIGDTTFVSLRDEVVLTGDAQGRIVVGGTTEAGRANLNTITSNIGLPAGTTLASNDTGDSGVGVLRPNANARIDYGTNDISAPPLTPVVLNPQPNQPQVG